MASTKCCGFVVRIPFRQGEADVIVRVNDRPADTIILRFTAFQTESSQDDRLDERHGRARPKRPEAALLDHNNTW